MKLNEVFQSDYLKAEDLNGRPVTVKISAVTLVDMGQGAKQERKLVLAFHGAKKKFVSNKTNSSTIAKLYGDDTDLWIGQPITLRPAEVEFQGEMVMAIRVSLQKPVTGSPVTTAAAPAPAPLTPPEAFPPETGGEESDSVPF